MRIYFVLNDIFICFQKQKVFENTPADSGATLSWFDCCVRGLALIVHYVAPPRLIELSVLLLESVKCTSNPQFLKKRAFPSVPVGFELGSEVGICNPEAAAKVVIGRICHYLHKVISARKEAGALMSAPHCPYTDGTVIQVTKV